MGLIEITDALEIGRDSRGGLRVTLQRIVTGSDIQITRSGVNRLTKPIGGLEREPLPTGQGIGDAAGIKVSS